MEQKSDTAPESADNFGVNKTILLTLLSTTLRVFVPVLVLFGIGAVIDFNFDFKPYGMIVGTVAGMIIAGALVYSQIRAIKKEGKK